jgi:hypothetical protein
VTKDNTIIIIIIIIIINGVLLVDVPNYKEAEFVWRAILLVLA